MSIVTVPRLLELEKAERDLAALLRPRPIAEYHEDMGDVLWWCWEKVTEPTGHVSHRWLGESPYVGSPNDCGFTVQIETKIITNDGAQPTSIRNFDVGGWPGYHTHWSPLPKVRLP